MQRLALGGAVTFLVAALVGVTGTPRAVHHHTRHDVPLTGNGRHLVVEARLNGRVSGPMLVDTGASYCVLTRATARRLGITNGRTSVPVATANGEVAAALVELDSVQLLGAGLAGVDAVVMDAVEPPLIGILGLSFLTHFRFSVDHRAGLLRLER
jgi:clan AA aspartic protease (TIGR02281 family)